MRKQQVDLDTIFASIAQDMIEKAERVKCSLTDFYNGLELIREELNTRIECKETELDKR